MIDKNILAKYQSMDCYENHEPIETYTSHFYDKDTPLHWAAFNGNLQDLEIMLQNINLKEINIAGDIGNTPLLNAICGKKYNCVELLLKYGADPYQENDYGDNAFDWGDEKTVAILTKFGFFRTYAKVKETFVVSLSNHNVSDPSTSSGRTKTFKMRKSYF